MSFIEELEAGDKRGLFRSDTNYITYSTGIIPLDYANGFWQEVDDGAGNKIMIPITGITGGTVVTIIGDTGTGKTTFASQMGYNIIAPFPDSTLHFIDTEKAMSMNRLIRLTRAPYNDPRLVLKKENTSIEDVLEMITRVCDIKESGGKRYMYEVPGRTYDGKPMQIYIPTVFILDSLPNFNSKEFNVEDLGTNTDGMRGAKDVTRFFTNVLDRAWKYNITIIVINHIRPKTDMNPYVVGPKGIMMLGQGEQLPRGQVAQYYSNTFFRIRFRKSDAYTMDEHGFTGYKATIQLAKSRTNQVGTSFPVAYLGEDGFDSYFTIYEYANALGLIKGRNPYLYFDGLEAFKFNRKDFRKMMATDENFAAQVMWKMKPYFEALLGTPRQRIRPEDIPEDSEEDYTSKLVYGGLTIPTHAPELIAS